MLSIDDAVQIGVQAVHETGFVTVLGEEYMHHVYDFVPAQHQPGIAADGVRFDQLLAQ